MAETIIDRLNRLLGGNPSVQRVADDLQLTSELILLVRMMFADGELKEAELEVFKRICAGFGLAERDVPEILKYLRDFGYETSAFDAASMFRELDDSRKQELLVALLQMAKADSHLDKSEEELIRKTAAILDLSAADISRMRKG